MSFIEYLTGTRWIMWYDKELGKREVETDTFEQVLDAFSDVIGWNVLDEWEGDAEQVEGSPDRIIGLDGRAFGIELAEIRDVEDAGSYIDEAYRIAAKKSESYSRRGLFRFPIALIMYSYDPPLFDMRQHLAGMVFQEDFEGLGFAGMWAVDVSNAYYSGRDPRRPADLFCFKPTAQFGFYRGGALDRKPFG
jgi:hypothetical protein